MSKTKKLSVEVTDIDWDIDSDCDRDLPTDCTIEIDYCDPKDVSDFNDAIVEALCDEYEYTINSFSIGEITGIEE